MGRLGTDITARFRSGVDLCEGFRSGIGQKGGSLGLAGRFVGDLLELGMASSAKEPASAKTLKTVPSETSHGSKPLLNSEMMRERASGSRSIFQRIMADQT